MTDDLMQLITDLNRLSIERSHRPIASIAWRLEKGDFPHLPIHLNTATGQVELRTMPLPLQELVGVTATSCPERAIPGGLGDQVKHIALLAEQMATGKGFDPCTWDNLPSKMAFVQGEVDKALAATSSEEFVLELADVGLRLLALMHGALAADFSPRVPTLREVQMATPHAGLGVDDALQAVRRHLSGAVQSWRDDNVGESRISLELALYHLFICSARAGTNLVGSMSAKLKEHRAACAPRPQAHARLMRVVVISGSRDLVNSQPIRAVIQGASLVVTGDARGADAMADGIARELGIPCFPLRAMWEAITPAGVLGRAAGHERNGRMATLALVLRAAGYEVVCCAFPTRNSRGTWDFVRQLRDAGFEVRVLH